MPVSFAKVAAVPRTEHPVLFASYANQVSGKLTKKQKSEQQHAPRTTSPAHQDLLKIDLVCFGRWHWRKSSDLSTIRLGQDIQPSEQGGTIGFKDINNKCAGKTNINPYPSNCRKKLMRFRIRSRVSLLSTEYLVPKFIQCGAIKVFKKGYITCWNTCSSARFDPDKAKSSALLEQDPRWWCFASLLEIAPTLWWHLMEWKLKLVLKARLPIGTAVRNSEGPLRMKDSTLVEHAKVGCN